MMTAGGEQQHREGKRAGVESALGTASNPATPHRLLDFAKNRGLAGSTAQGGGDIGPFKKRLAEYFAQFPSRAYPAKIPDGIVCRLCSTR
jgi:hypothetical protein